MVVVVVMLLVVGQGCHLASCERVCVFAGVLLARPPKGGRDRREAFVEWEKERQVVG